VLERFGDLHASAQLWNRDRAARRGASRRNALLLACAAVAAAALGVAQHASGKNPPALPRCGAAPTAHCAVSDRPGR
jgi:hypothetical protein